MGELVKAISIHQPWAGLIVTGRKDVEIRAWNYLPSYRGRLLIHASGTMTPREERMRERWMAEDTATQLACEPIGALIGEVEVLDVIEYTSRAQFEQDYNRHFNRADRYRDGLIGLQFANATRYVTPIRWRGQLGLFDVDMSAVGSRLREIDARARRRYEDSRRRQ